MATPPDTHETLVSLSLRFWQTRRISGVDRSAVGPQRERNERWDERIEDHSVCLAPEGKMVVV